MNACTATNQTPGCLTREETEALYQRQAFNTAAIANINARGIQNIAYDMPNSFQGPRSIRFGFKVQF
jgi:hypothetical protein